jgi:16S rRNA G1207 methylase RsmC
MDLCEITNNRNRHPWELTRTRILINILQKQLPHKTKIRALDVGCGDAFISDKLQKSIGLESYDGVDINLSDSQIRQLSKIENNIILHNKFNGLSNEYYNLVLILVVI